MKILGIDSSGMVASVALMEDDLLIAEYTVNHKKTHSQTLMPMLDEVKRSSELDLATVDAIAVAAGPGSFTGLRIGSATVKGLGMALDKPIVEVSTLEALAWQCCEAKESLVCPMLDARRNQTYCAAYGFEDGKCREHIPPSALAIEEFIESLNRLGRPVLFLGDGVPVFRDVIEDKCTAEYSFVPAHKNRQSAAALCQAAAVKLRRNETVSAAEHRPVYLRVSQAERELAKKQALGEDKA